MQTILEALMEANEIAEIRALHYADIREFNSFADSVTGLDVPLNLVIPTPVQYTLTQPISNGILQLEGFILTRLKEDTNDWRSPALEAEYIAPMRQLGVNFLMALMQTTIADLSKPAPTATFNREIMFLPHHFFGVSYRCSIPIKAKAC